MLVKLLIRFSAHSLLLVEIHICTIYIYIYVGFGANSFDFQPVKECVADTPL